MESPMAETSYTVGEAAELLAAPGFSAKKAHDRLQALLRRDRNTPELLHSYGKRNDAGARVYPFSEVAKAKILFALIDSGLADRSVLWSADQALFGKQLDKSMSEVERTRVLAQKTPIKRAIAAIESGDWPTFILTTFVHDQTGERVRRGQVMCEGDAPLPPPGGDDAFIPLSGIVIQLRPLLFPLIADAGRKAN